MKERGKKRQLIGIVISNKMDKTIIVRVNRLVQHKLYKKYISRKTNFVAHDKDNDCKVGDKVLIIETRPLSKTKRWRVRKIVKKAV